MGIKVQSVYQRKKVSRPASRRGLMNVGLLAAISSSLILLGCGGGGGGDGTSTPAPGADTTAPTVTLSAPATANRTTTLTANASDNVGVTQVEFRLDGAALGTATAAPYSFNWDTSTAADGAHVLTAVASDAAGNSTTSAAVNVEVRNQQQFALDLTPAQENPPTGSSATGSGTINVNLLTGATTGAITLAGFTVTAAHIHDGFAGINGPIVIGLAQDPGNAQRWQVPANALLTAPQIDRLMAGALYMNAHSAQFPGGEVRAQLAPANIRVIFTELSGQEEVPPVNTTASARAATTVDSAIGAVTIHVNTTDLATADRAHIHTGEAGVSGPITIGLTRDATTASLWSAVAASVTDAQLQDFNANRWYVNVHTPANPNGEVRGQIIATQNPGPTPFTFTEIQTQIFNASCAQSGCHSGATPQAGMNLSAGSAYANLVGVASSEVPALQRVEPGDADNSYIIHKLEGRAGIVGARMPFGGPFLDQATIDRIGAWIDAGAPNN